MFFIDCDVVYPIANASEFFQLKIVFADKIHTEYHYVFPNKSKEWGISATPQHKQLNIMVVLVDSLSHSHTKRSLPKTYKYLEKHSRTVLMKVSTVIEWILFNFHLVILTPVSVAINNREIRALGGELAFNHKLACSPFG